MSDEKQQIQNWLEQIPEEVRPQSIQLLNVVLGQSQAWITEWVKLLTGGQTSEAYAMAYAAMEEAEFLQQGQDITAASQAANLENAKKMASQRDAVYNVMMGLITFGLSTLLKYAPFILAV